MQFEFGYIIRGRPTHKRDLPNLEAAIRYGCELASMNGVTWVEIYEPDGAMHIRELDGGKWVDALNA